MQLSFAWERWQELATKKFDFNLTFQSTAALTLEKMLPPQEQGPLKVTLSSCSLSAFKELHRA